MLVTKVATVFYVGDKSGDGVFMLVTDWMIFVTSMLLQLAVGLTFEHHNDIECIIIFSRSNFPFATRTFHWFRCSCSHIRSPLNHKRGDPWTVWSVWSASQILNYNKCRLHKIDQSRLCNHVKKQWFDSQNQCLYNIGYKN